MRSNENRARFRGFKSDAFFFDPPDIYLDFSPSETLVSTNVVAGVFVGRNQGLGWTKIQVDTYFTMQTSYVVFKCTFSVTCTDHPHREILLL